MPAASFFCATASGLQAPACAAPQVDRAGHKVLCVESGCGHAQYGRVKAECHPVRDSWFKSSVTCAAVEVNRCHYHVTRVHAHVFQIVKTDSAKALVRGESAVHGTDSVRRAITHFCSPTSALGCKFQLKQ